MVEFNRVPIVEEGVDIDEENEAGQTALHVAIINNDLEMVKFLLHQGANVNRRTRVFENDERQETCECAYTCYCSHVAHEFGNEMRDDGQNALHLAAKYSSDEILKLLIQRIENVNGTSNDGSTALHYATQKLLREDDEDISAMELLLNSGAGVNARNLDGKTPLYLAVKFEKLKLVRYLLSRGADVNIPTTKGSTPLYSAIMNCNVELVNLLLANKASIDVENDRNQSPLFYALRVLPKSETRTTLVKLLLDHGVSADSRNSYGSTILHVAILDKDEPLARLMIARGCPIDAKDCFDMSPLAVAVCTNSRDLAKLLLERGADANVSIKSSSVLEHAVMRRNEPMVDLLLRHEADVRDTHRVLLAACRHKNTRIIQKLVDHGADVNHKDAEGTTPLMRVIHQSSGTMIRFLIDRGARINERNCRGNTAMHLLMHDPIHGTVRRTVYLLEKGANLNIVNDRGYTVFEYLLVRCYTEHKVKTIINYIALLIDRGLYVNPKITNRIATDHRWSTHLKECLTELGRMRGNRILDKCSYYDVVTKKHSALSVLFRENNVDLEFEQGLEANAFLHYRDILERCFERKNMRSKLLDNAVDVLMTNDVFRDILPLEVVQYLCQYLSNEDLEKLS